MSTKNVVRYKNCELEVTRASDEYNLGMKFSNTNPRDKPNTVDTKLSEDAMIQFYEHLTLVVQSRADELRALSQRYDSMLGLVKKVGEAR